MESEGESSRRPRSQQPEYAAYKFSHPEPSAGRVKCNVCQQLIRRRGFGMHQKKCLREEDDKRRNLEYFRAQALANSNAPLGSGTSNTDFHPNEQDRIQRELTPEHELSYSEENAGLSDFSGDPATSLADTMDIDEEEEEAACVILNGAQPLREEALPVGTQGSEYPNPSTDSDVDDIFEDWRPTWGPEVNPAQEFTSVVGPDGRRGYHELLPGDIMTVYHPRSGLLTRVDHKAAYIPRAENMRQTTDSDRPCHDTQDSTSNPGAQRETSTSDPLPWKPFVELLDFDFADVAQDAHLNQDQVDRLLTIIHKAAGGKPQGFTLRNHRDLRAAWDKASQLQSSFLKHEIGVRYKKTDYMYEVHARPIWNWVLDQLSDPKLSPHMHWDSRRLYCYDGKSWVSFINEPFTASRAWNVQSKLPPGGKPLGLIVYADKTKLSSFGTAKGYPVMMCISNLPQTIRNGNGVGSIRIVGWLPIVPEEAEHNGKTTFTNFKRVVWHESFRVLLETLAPVSQLGWMFQSPSGQQYHLFPFVHILSADYEEQCVMSLIRGFGGHHPCPVCLVPADGLTHVHISHTRRVAQTAQKIVWNKRLNLGQKDTLLKEMGLRNIESGFWILANSDPHEAIAIDRMHVNEGGNFSDHLWARIQEILEDFGREAMAQVDAQMASLPRWRNINHFNAVMKVHFTDAGKYRDISKFVIFSAHNVLTESKHPEGYLLLRCLRAYLEHDMYFGLEQHTEHTLRGGRAWLLRFSDLIAKYSQQYPDAKNWNYPKFHAGAHTYYDIEDKGVSATYCTKSFEGHHSEAKDSYQLDSNKKDVAPQILRVVHQSLVRDIIRANIDLWLAHQRALAEERGDNLDNDNESDSSTPRYQFGHIYLGSRQAPCRLGTIEQRSSIDSAFRNFAARLTGFVNLELRSDGTPLVEYGPDIEIIECRFIKPTYESVVTWALSTDFLRCAPMFYGQPRYDAVIVRTQARDILFGQLVFSFVCRVGNGDVEPIALIWPMDKPPESQNLQARKDRHLGLHRLRARPRGQCRLVSLRSVIRGAMLVDTYDTAGDFFVVDLIDSDMFIRLKEVFSR